MSPDLQDELSVPLPLKQAAADMGVTVRTLHRWITAGHLPAYTGPDGLTYVIERDLIACERDRRRSRNQGRPRPTVNAA